MRINSIDFNDRGWEGVHGEMSRWWRQNGAGDSEEGWSGGGNFLVISCTALIWKMHGTSVRNKFICMAQRSCWAQDAPETQCSWRQHSLAPLTGDVEKKRCVSARQCPNQQQNNHIQRINAEDLTWSWPSWLWPVAFIDHIWCHLWHRFFHNGRY